MYLYQYKYTLFKGKGAARVWWNEMAVFEVRVPAAYLFAWNEL
jgi:hypothetical protein